MKAILKPALSMGKGLKNLLMAIFIKDSMPEENLMAMESIIGQMDATIKEGLKTDCDKVTACGRKEQETVTNTKVNILQIKSMGMVSLLGRAEMCIREAIEKIFVADLVKCIGMMVAFTKDSGLMEYNTEKD